MNRKNAFTLIELLVVIAIIAILAAILFPVFAQAKVAAKKTQDLSHQKQIGTAVQVYLADYDDNFPLVFPTTTNGLSTDSFGFVDTPADWDPTVSAAYHNSRQPAFPNNTQPYIKNTQMFNSPGGVERPITGWVYPAGGRYYNVGYSMNGLLHGYNATAVNAPSQLRLMTAIYGNHNFKGAARPSPRLRCPLPGTCRYVPSTPTCSGARNGEWSELSNPNGATMWVYGNGVNAVMADSSAKFQRVAQGPTNRSDFRTDFWAQYDAGGRPRWSEWQDTNFCHTMLFMPDFDFQNYGTPVLF